MNRSLFELQEVDNDIARIKRERARLDDGGALRGERDTLRAARDESANALKKLQADNTKHEDELRATEEKIKRSQTRLMSATTAHEISALERDIKGLGLRRGESDEALLMLMDEIESAAKDLAEREAQLATKEAETAHVEAVFSAESARLESELIAVVAAREAMAQAIESAFLQKYADFAKRFHGVAVAHPERGACSACGMALTAFNLKEARAKEWPTCESCGRLLFLDE